MQTEKDILAPLSSVESEESAAQAGLIYVNDTLPGIRRLRNGDDWTFIGVNGKPITDEKVIKRIKAIGIPPAYTDVWICPKANGHIQATGRDQRGRKQYRYHPRWREVRDETKYNRMLAFIAALPDIRKQVNRDLTLRGLPRNKVLATIVRLLETTFIRIGNAEYARENKSFGLTTLRDRHVDINGSKIRFTFRGKHGKEHEIDVQDRRLAAIVKRCQEIPGYELFQYFDEEGNRQTVDSSDVNAYLRHISGQDFTAKDFRTWGGTVLAAKVLHEFEPFDDDKAAKKNIVRAIEHVASRLGNTPSICRKCYVHPSVVSAYMDGTLRRALEQRIDQELEGDHTLKPLERSVLLLLQSQLEGEGKDMIAG
ncbi:MAG: DNA topoisomerase IB [Herpetosiphon sp.]